MTYAELVSELKKLQLEEVRTNTSQFFEFVIRTELLSQLHPILERYFGHALKPTGQDPTKELNKLIAAYGGIRKEQTLYHLEFPEIVHYAMLWPWANGILLTVKIVQTPKKK